MYDALTARYTFPCPARGETSVPLSSFRRLERLPGASHPAVYQVAFACPCGEEHPGLVAHDDLDWAPLGLAAGEFLNLMTARLEAVEVELGDSPPGGSRRGSGRGASSATRSSGRGRCSRRRSSCSRGRRAGWSARGALPGLRAASRSTSSPTSTSTCRSTTTATIGVVEHVFAADALRTVEEFRAELYSASFDARRLLL